MCEYTLFTISTRYFLNTVYTLMCVSFSKNHAQLLLFPYEDKLILLLFSFSVKQPALQVLQKLNNYITEILNSRQSSTLRFISRICTLIQMIKESIANFTGIYRVQILIVQQGLLPIYTCIWKCLHQQQV